MGGRNLAVAVDSEPPGPGREGRTGVKNHEGSLRNLPRSPGFQHGSSKRRTQAQNRLRGSRKEAARGRLDCVRNQLECSSNF